MPLTARIVRVSQGDWCCAAIREVFSPTFYRRIVEGLDELTWSESRQSFYRQREVNLMDNDYYGALFDENIRSQIAASVGQFFGETLDAGFDIAAHKMITGDYIDVHTDANKHGETHRMTITLNETWSVTEGGVLLILNDGSISSVRDAWLPTSNNGFIFKITDSSYHAVSPIVGPQPRYSLILTFKSKDDVDERRPNWMPFVLHEDVVCAVSTAGYMGISAGTFDAPYKYDLFSSTEKLQRYVGGHLENAPDKWSYENSCSMNVDQHGNQPKGSDKDRTERIGGLRRIPPILVVRRKSGKFCLVDGSHRLSFAHDGGMPVGVAVYDEL